LNKGGKLNDEEIAKLLQKHWKVSIITKEEANHIDYELKCKTTMPAGWCFDEGAALV
jgi:hypothetical protein